MKTFFQVLVVVVIFFLVFAVYPLRIGQMAEEEGTRNGIYNTQVEAVKLGYGVFNVDEKGKIRFEWKDKNAILNELLSGKPKQQEKEPTKTEMP